MGRDIAKEEEKRFSAPTNIIFDYLCRISIGKILSNLQTQMAACSAILLSNLLVVSNPSSSQTLSSSPPSSQSQVMFSTITTQAVIPTATSFKLHIEPYYKSSNYILVSKMEPDVF